MCLHCTSPWRGSQSRISFSIGNLYWRQMNQDAKGGQHQDQRMGPGIKTLLVFFFLYVFLCCFFFLFKTTNKQSPWPENRHVLSKLNRPSQSQGMVCSWANDSHRHMAPETRGSDPRRDPGLSKQVVGNYTCSIHEAFFLSFSSKWKKKMLFFFSFCFFFQTFFGQSAFVFKQIR